MDTPRDSTNPPEVHIRLKSRRISNPVSGSYRITPGPFASTYRPSTLFVDGIINMPNPTSYEEALKMINSLKDRVELTESKLSWSVKENDHLKKTVRNLQAENDDVSKALAEEAMKHRDLRMAVGKAIGVYNQCPKPAIQPPYRLVYAEIVVTIFSTSAIFSISIFTIYNEMNGGFWTRQAIVYLRLPKYAFYPI